MVMGHHVFLVKPKDFTKERIHRDRLKRLLLQIASDKNLLGLIKRKKRFEVSQLRVS
ncbi:hypothetical protein YC2023_100475 [Brassica napus]